MKLAIMASVFMFFFFVFLSILKNLEQRLSSQKRVKIYALHEAAATLETVDVNKKSKRDYRFLLRPISVSMKKSSVAKKWGDKLRRADILLKGEEFLAIWYLLVLVSALLIVISPKFIVIFLLAVIYPPIYIQSKINKRIKKFNSQLNDALAILANSMRAGFSFFQAMDTVRKEMPEPISKEFTKTLKEINYGTAIEDALKNLNERVGSQDLDLVITAVLIQRQVGGNMSEILENISQTIRDRIKILGEIKTLTAQGRMSGYIIGGLPVVLLIVLSLINPDYSSVLYTTNKGIGILAAGAFSEFLGIILIKKIIAIEV